MASYLRPRRGKKSTAESQNIVLKRGEVFFESPGGGVGTGTGRIKIGDGTTAYTSLPYFLNPDNFVTNISTAVVTFTETSETNNTTLLSRIVTGAALNTIVASIKNLFVNIITDITYQEITYDNWLNLTEQQKENGNYDVTGVPSISSSYVILYDGASFNDKNEHTLNDTISNYKCIEVITNQGSQKFFTNKSNSAELRYSSTGYDVSTPSNGGVILYLHFLHFNNNKIAIGNAHRWYWYKAMSAWTYEFTNTSSWIYISRIIGYK